MAILDIRKYPDPVLSKKAKEVEGIDEETARLLDNMKETMKEKDGVGLAANQVGVLKRIIVLMSENHSDVLALVNPIILKKSKEKERGEEGCLSFPGLFLQIKRSKQVDVEALNEKGEKVNIKASGLFARVLQHEIDHLDGILFFKRVSIFQRLKLWL